MYAGKIIEIYEAKILEYFTKLECIKLYIAEGAMFCSSCGAKNLDGGKFCTKCGESLVGEITRSEVFQEKGGEKIFFQDDNVLVTNTRYVVNGSGQTFAMSQINNVAIWEEPANIKPALWCFGLSVIGFFMYVVPGVILVLIGLGLWKQAKSKFYVKLSTSSGAAQTFFSEDVVYIQKVVDSINEAIIYRG